MKKIFLFTAFLMILLLTGNTIVAQVDSSKKSVIHIGVWDPVGSNGKESKLYTNTFSFNLLYGKSQNEQAFTLSGLAATVENNATGVQIAGLANVIGGYSHGLTFAGLSNVAGGNATGIMVSGLANVIGGNSRGLTFTGLSNIVGGDASGMMVSGLANISSSLRGIQLAGLTNITQVANGIQFSGLANISQAMNGLQFSGLINISQATRGMQISGLANIAQAVDGLQFSGLANVAQVVKGFQFAGLYNRAQVVKGVQFSGLVNKAEKSDYPIGLINLITNGEMGVALTWDESQNAMATFRSGSRVMYGIVGLGYNFKSSESLFAMEGGFGAHFSIAEKFRINTELVENVMTDFDGNTISKSSLRVLPAYRFGKMEVFAGPTFNYMETDDEKLTDLFPGHSVWKKTLSSGGKQQMFFGYMLGVQYVF